MDQKTLENKRRKLDDMVKNQICPQCGRKGIKEETPFADEKTISYHCGYCRIQDSLRDYENYNLDWNKVFPLSTW